MSAYLLRIGRRTVVHSFEDGFVHAGNFAYLSLLTLFPFFILLSTVAGALGRTAEGLAAVRRFLEILPQNVAQFLAKPISDVMSQQNQQGLITFGIIVGIWTIANFIETMRDILRRAHDISAKRPFWHYRLGSMAMALGGVILMLTAFSAQMLITASEQFITRLLPFAADILGWLGISRLAPAVALFGALFLIFQTLTPMRYRLGCPKWPGALLTTLIWLGTTMALPVILSSLADYSLTYGSLAGVMIALLFFFIIGFGFVLGAELNAALALEPKNMPKEG